MMTPRDREKDAPPGRLAETTPPPSGDYSYTVEIVMRMQDTMGQLKEAVTSLKEQSKHHDEKLEQIGKDVHAVGKDVHAAKVTIWVVCVLTVAAAALVGWIVTTYISAHAGH
jgi:hypothetical protein